MIRRRSLLRPRHFQTIRRHEPLARRLPLLKEQPRRASLRPCLPQLARADGLRLSRSKRGVPTLMGLGRLFPKPDSSPALQRLKSGEPLILGYRITSTLSPFADGVNPSVDTSPAVFQSWGLWCTGARLYFRSSPSSPAARRAVRQSVISSFGRRGLGSNPSGPPGRAPSLFGYRLHRLPKGISSLAIDSTHCRRRLHGEAPLS